MSYRAREVERLHPELWDQLVPELRRIAKRMDDYPLRSDRPMLWLSNHTATLREAANSVERLRAALAEDAERLDWLEAQDGDPRTGNVTIRCAPQWGTAQIWTDNEQAAAYHTLRDAIDAAMDATEGDT